MITISYLSNKKSGNNYSYSDLHLDLIEKKHTTNKQNNRITTGNDIVADTDALAIQNAVINLIFQKRYLNPSVNLSLKEFIGQPITEGVSRVLGNKIYNGLLLWEPRIKVEKILVGKNPDRNSFDIAIIYTLVNFPKEIQTISGEINNSNGVFLLNNLNN